MKWTLIEKIFVHGIVFVQGIVLARLLTPSDFGLTAMLGVFLGVAQLMVESGLGTALVVVGSCSDRVEKCVFIWNGGMAVGIYLLLAIAAPFIAGFYDAPILLPLMWVMGLSILTSAMCVVPMARLVREKRFGKISLVNSVAFGVGAIFSISAASLGAGVWSIAWLAIVQGVTRIVMLAGVGTKSEEKSEECDAGEFRPLLSYGLKLTVSGMIHTVYLNIYQLVIGKAFNPAMVGLFTRGQRFATLPVEVVNDSVARVALPSLARGEASVKVKGISVKWWMINVFLLWPCLATLWILATPIVRLLIGEQWLECVPYMRILILGVVFTPISNLALTKIRASGRLNPLLLTDAIKKPLQIGGLVVGAFFGIEGLCWAVVAGEVFEATVDSAVVWRAKI